MDNITRAMQAVKRIDDSPDLVDIMIGIEDYLDRNDMYAYKNWMLGELVDGPYIQPYWISVTFKWPYKSMPDPQGGMRLIPQGTKVSFKLDKENQPQPIEKPGDYKPGTHKPKIKAIKVWLVELMIPRRFIDDIDDEVMDLYDERAEDIDTASDANANGATEEDMTQGNIDDTQI